MGTGGRSRTVLAGLAAGLVLNVGGMAYAFLVDLPAAFARFGVEPSAGVALLHVALRFGVGMAAVRVWVGMQGRGGASLLGVAALVWFIGYVPGSAVLHELGALDAWSFGVGLVWGFAEVAIALGVGARVLGDSDG